MVRPINERLAEYFDGQAYLLTNEIEPDPRRARRSASADDMNELADFVRQLPPDDERLLMLDILDRSETDPYTPWDDSAALRFRADDEGESCDEFLTGFASAQEAGKVEAVEMESGED